MVLFVVWELSMSVLSQVMSILKTNLLQTREHFVAVVTMETHLTGFFIVPWCTKHRVPS
jgi:hypothetical protein